MWRNLWPGIGQTNTFVISGYFQNDQIVFDPEHLIRYQSRPVPLVSVEEVNQWVENATNGHISKFLESIPTDVVLMLMNAVYFKGEPSDQKRKSCPLESPNRVSSLPGEWQTQFDPLATSKGVFYLDTENSVLVDMMKSVQYSFRLMHDPELVSQVKYQLSGAFCHADVTTSGKEVQDEGKME